MELFAHLFHRFCVNRRICAFRSHGWRKHVVDVCGVCFLFKLCSPWSKPETISGNNALSISIKSKENLVLCHSAFLSFFFILLIFVDRDSSRLVGACGPDVPNSQFYATAQLAQVSSCALLKCLLSGVLSSCGNDHDLIIRLFFFYGPLGFI